ncbi:MAG: hypothetical protein HY235_20615 [Acidobacteria bacterium]|nr:hypothetical protein [Acidobacteriota bacterium]
MLFLWLLTLLMAGSLQAATLERLTLDDMIQKSTAIVSGKVTGSSTVLRGTVIYTRYRIRIADQWKGSGAAETEIYVPGGKYGSMVQTFSGSPALSDGQDYVLFLWAGRSGLAQVIGLSQGLFQLKRDPKGELVLTRPAAGDVMLDSSGRLVEDTPVSLRLRDVVDRIQRSLTGATK